MNSLRVQPQRVLVTGAGGFLGHHLVGFLKHHGYWVRGVDLKHPEFDRSEADEFLLRDLQRLDACLQATEDVEDVYALAADMGGMGFISAHQARILRHNTLIDCHTLEAARQHHVRRYFYASSACVYPSFKQQETWITPLKEEDAYPAQPGEAYGWEKLTAEQLCQQYRAEYGMETRIARFHNIFGPLGTWRGGREKAPAAICRKVAVAKLTGLSDIEIWGDGEQTRSFCYVDDCIQGIYQLMRSEYPEPLNLGQDRMITINGLVDIVSEIAGMKLVKKHVPGPQGVRGRNSDNTRARGMLGWEPRISLEEGLATTYQWIEAQVREALIGCGAPPALVEKSR